MISKLTRFYRTSSIHISPITPIPTLIVSVMSADFLKPKGNYRDLIAFQKTECIYDITFWFVKH